ncbi:acyl carrier protein [Chitinophaga sp. RAB17]|uniref:acyl carrier protein n=1 Tax=Chitinophaga sp. RAB17 TaxID=3233049 RepID=UPI003F90CF36
MDVTTQAGIKATIREFLQQRVGQEISFSETDDVFTLGLTSLFALELVVFLEKTFDITVENEDLDLQNFNTVNHLEAFILKKKGQL